MTATLTKTLGSLDDFRGTLCVPGDPDYPRVRAITTRAMSERCCGARWTPGW